MEEVRLLLKRLDAKAKKKFGEHYLLWDEPYPFPGGCSMKNPKHKADYIVTVKFLKSILDNVKDLEGLESQLSVVEEEIKQLSTKLNEARSKAARLREYKYFIKLKI